MIIILNQPQLPQNIGAVARVLMNFCVKELRLIQPQSNPLDAQAIATAAGAEYVLKNAVIFNDLESAIEDLHYLLGTCGDFNRQGVRTYYNPMEAFQACVHQSDHHKIGILFGCERTGLSQEDLSHCHATIRIPVNPEFSSMNLSHAVGIIAYEWKKVQRQSLDPGPSYNKNPLATQKEKESLFNNLIQKLDQAEYWRVPSKKPLMQENLANLFFRCSLTRQEIQTLFGVISTLHTPRKSAE